MEPFFCLLKMRRISWLDEEHVSLWRRTSVSGVSLLASYQFHVYFHIMCRFLWNENQFCPTSVWIDCCWVKLHPNPLHNFRSLNVAVFELRNAHTQHPRYAFICMWAYCCQGHRSNSLPYLSDSESYISFINIRKNTSYLTVNTQLLHYKCCWCDTQVHWPCGRKQSSSYV